MAGFVGTHFEGGKIAKEFFDDFGVGRCEVGAFSDIAGKIKEGERGRGPISGELPVAVSVPLRKGMRLTPSMLAGGVAPVASRQVGRMSIEWMGS